MKKLLIWPAILIINCFSFGYFAPVAQARSIHPCHTAAYFAYKAGLHNERKLTQAVALAYGESSCTLISNHICCNGAWQINTRVWLASASILLRSWKYNAHWMMLVSHRGTNWRPWIGDRLLGCIDVINGCPARVVNSVKSVLSRHGS